MTYYVPDYACVAIKRICYTMYPGESLYASIKNLNSCLGFESLRYDSENFPIGCTIQRFFAYLANNPKKEKKRIYIALCSPLARIK